MSDTDELREQIAEMIADYHGRSIQAHTLFRSYELAGDLLPVVAAVVAEARTEAVETAERIAATFRKNEDRFREMGHASIGIEYSRKALGAEEVVAALRGVGNQNAEPRWSANRLEEVLREGLPDQNAEPAWEHAHRYTEMDGRHYHQRVCPGEFAAHRPDGHTADGTPYWNYTQVRRIKAGPWLPADQKGTEQ